MESRGKWDCANSLEKSPYLVVVQENQYSLLIYSKLNLYWDTFLMSTEITLLCTIYNARFQSKKDTCIIIDCRLSFPLRFCLLVYCLTFHSRNSFSYGDVTISSDELKKGYPGRSAHLSKETFISRYACCNTGPIFSPVSTELHPIQLP
jgi:hypothetical protein